MENVCLAQTINAYFLYSGQTVYFLVCVTYA